VVAALVVALVVVAVAVADDHTSVSLKGG